MEVNICVISAYIHNVCARNGISYVKGTTVEGQIYVCGLIDSVSSGLPANNEEVLCGGATLDAELYVGKGDVEVLVCIADVGAVTVILVTVEGYKRSGAVPLGNDLSVLYLNSRGNKLFRQII